MRLNHLLQTVAEWDGHSESLCPVCQSPVFARKGLVRVWHFSHYMTPREGVITREQVIKSRACPNTVTETDFMMIGKMGTERYGARPEASHEDRKWQTDYVIRFSDRPHIKVDSCNPKTRQIRQYVSSARNFSESAHHALVQAGYNVVYILDGTTACYSRAAAKDNREQTIIDFRTIGNGDLLKPWARKIASVYTQVNDRPKKIHVRLHLNGWMWKEQDHSKNSWEALTDKTCKNESFTPRRVAEAFNAELELFIETNRHLHVASRNWVRQMLQYRLVERFSAAQLSHPVK